MAAPSPRKTPNGTSIFYYNLRGANTMVPARAPRKIESNDHAGPRKAPTMPII